MRVGVSRAIDRREIRRNATAINTFVVRPSAGKICGVADADECELSNERDEEETGAVLSPHTVTEP
jgi:hypothetical protein